MARVMRRSDVCVCVCKVVERRARAQRRGGGGEEEEEEVARARARARGQRRRRRRRRRRARAAAAAAAAAAAPFWKSLAVAAMLKLFLGAFGAYLFGRLLGMRFGGALVTGLVFAFGTSSSSGWHGR